MYWCLLGVLVVIIGFAVKLEPIAIIVVSAIVTAIFGGINVIDLLETVGTTFVANRNQLDHHHSDDSDRHTGEKRSEGSCC